MAIRRIHAINGALATLTVATFWCSTVVSEVFFNADAIAKVKHWIALYGLMPMTLFMMVAGATGSRLAADRPGQFTHEKAKRMSVLRQNGLFLMVPLAIILNWKAAAREFDTLFYTAQAVELIVGLLQLKFLLSNVRAGLQLSGRTGG